MIVTYEEAYHGPEADDPHADDGRGAIFPVTVAV